MANVTLLRRDSYLDLVEHGVKVDTVAALRNIPLHMASLFSDDVISKGEEEIFQWTREAILADPAISLLGFYLGLGNLRAKDTVTSCCLQQEGNEMRHLENARYNRVLPVHCTRCLFMSADLLTLCHHSAAWAYASA